VRPGPARGSSAHGCAGVGGGRGAPPTHAPCGLTPPHADSRPLRGRPWSLRAIAARSTPRPPGGYAEGLESDLRSLYAVINARLDRATAAVLHVGRRRAQHSAGGGRARGRAGCLAAGPSRGAARGPCDARAPAPAPCAPQHADEYANERNEITLGHVAGAFAWGVWVNTAKNPRLKVRRWRPGRGRGP
jgi:hypothetical protein